MKGLHVGNREVDSAYLISRQLQECPGKLLVTYPKIANGRFVEALRQFNQRNVTVASDRRENFLGIFANIHSM